MAILRAIGLLDFGRVPASNWAQTISFPIFRRGSLPPGLAQSRAVLLDAEGVVAFRLPEHLQVWGFNDDPGGAELSEPRAIHVCV